MGELCNPPKSARITEPLGARAVDAQVACAGKEMALRCQGPVDGVELTQCTVSLFVCQAPIPQLP